MDCLNAYDSSSNEDDEPKKIKIHLDTPIDATYQRRYRPKNTDSLLHTLQQKYPKASDGIADVPLNNHIASESKHKHVDPPKDEIVDFFGPYYPVGPAKPHIIIDSGPIEPMDLQQPRDTDVNYQKLKTIGHRSKDGPITYKTISQKDLLGDEYRLSTLKAGIVDTRFEDDAFKNLDDDYFVGDASARNNNIMALAHQAKSRSADFDAAKAERKHVAKKVRAKYGF